MNITSFSESKTDGINEDALESATHPQDQGVWIVALADGQGGRTGGAQAAQTAVKSALQMATAAPVRQLRKEPFWRQLLLDVDKAVSEEPEAGFTTFVGVAVTENSIVGVSSGDSQALLIPQSGNPITLTAKQKKNPPVGSMMCHPMAFSVSFLASSKLIVMSDGVYKFVSFELICAKVIELDAAEAIHAIREAAVGKSGTLYDDFSLLVIENTKGT